MLFETLTSISRFWRRAREETLAGLLTAEQTRKLLHRERSRSDRSGGCFSLLCFTSGEGGPAVFLRFLPILRRRLRLTDEIGWLDDRRLGVLLPDTSPAGAWTVVESIYQLVPPDLPTPLCDVFSYPTKPLSPDQKTGSGPLSPIEKTGSGSNPGNQGEEDRPPDKVLARRTGPLEALLLRPLPTWKRCLDLMVASVALLLLSPVFLLVALAVRLTSPGTILFCQRRAGLGGRPFLMYKFRTMVADAEDRKAALRAHSEQDGPAFKMKNDPRVTPVGRWLRTTSLDELPQLWNVLRGDMSLVGPRPLPCEEHAACDGWHRRRLDVVPGLTCIWQVRGRSPRVSFTEWMRMDMRYVHSQSLGQDLRLLLETIPAVVSRRGAE